MAPVESLPFKVYRRENGGKWTKVDEAATDGDAIGMVIRFRGGYAGEGDPPPYQVRGPRGIVPPVWLDLEKVTAEIEALANSVQGQIAEATTPPQGSQDAPSGAEPVDLDQEGREQEEIALGGPFSFPYPPELPEGYQGYRVLKMTGPSGQWKVAGEADTRDEAELSLPPRLRNVRPEGFHDEAEGLLRVGTTWPKWAIQGTPVTVDPDPAVAAADPDWQAGPVGPQAGEDLADYYRRRGQDMHIQALRADASEEGAQASPEPPGQAEAVAVDVGAGEPTTSYQVWRRPRPMASFELVAVAESYEAAERLLPGAPASGEEWGIQPPLAERNFPGEVAIPGESHTDDGDRLTLPQDRQDALQRALDEDMAATGAALLQEAVEVTAEAVKEAIRKPKRIRKPQADRAAHDLPEAGVVPTEAEVSAALMEALHRAGIDHPNVDDLNTATRDFTEAIRQDLYPSFSRYRVLYRPGGEGAWALAGEFDTLKEAENHIPEIRDWEDGKPDAAWSILLPAVLGRGGLWADEEPPLRLDNFEPGPGYLGSEDHFQRGREWGHMEAKQEAQGGLHGFHVKIKLDLHGAGTAGLEKLLAALAALKS